MKKVKNIFWVFTILFLMAEAASATWEEEAPNTVSPLTRTPLESMTTTREESYEFPEEILTQIFTLLEIDDLGRFIQTSSCWQKAGSNPQLWRNLGLKRYGDFFTQEDLSENPKQIVTQHYLSVLVNAENNLERITMLVQKYNLGSYNPLFKKNFNYYFLLDTMENNIDNFEELIAQRNSIAIERKIEGLAEGKYSYKKDLNACRNFNDLLIERGDKRALWRKIEALIRGGDRDPFSWEGQSAHGGDWWKTDITYPTYGYEKNHAALAELNESLVERGDKDAIERKIEGLMVGQHGYEKNPAAAVELNDALVEKGDQKAIWRKVEKFADKSTAATELNNNLVEKGDQTAIKRKIEGLAYGQYGYERNPAAAVEFNESLIERDDKKAIERKIDGLVKGMDGYEKSPAAAVEFNENLIERGDKDAIDRKVSGLSYGANGYEKNPVAAREFNETFVEKGDQKAIERKREGFLNGRYGYEKNLAAYVEFNDSLVEKRDQKAIERKIEGLAFGSYGGYERNPASAAEFNENLIERGDKDAIDRKIEGLLDGRYGYKKNLAAYVELNEVLVEKGDQKAIKRKIEGLAYRENGYDKNPVAALELTETLVEKKVQESIKWSIEGFLDGESGYDKNPVAAVQLNEIFVEKGDQKAIERKIWGLAYGRSGYEKSPVAARGCIEDLVVSEFSSVRAFGKYLKVFALKYGITELGYERRHVEAIAFIREYNVPF